MLVELNLTTCNPCRPGQLDEARSLLESAVYFMESTFKAVWDDSVAQQPAKLQGESCALAPSWLQSCAPPGLALGFLISALPIVKTVQLDQCSAVVPGTQHSKGARVGPWDSCLPETMVTVAVVAVQSTPQCACKSTVR